MAGLKMAGLKMGAMAMLALLCAVHCVGATVVGQGLWSAGRRALAERQEKEVAALVKKHQQEVAKLEASEAPRSLLRASSKAGQSPLPLVAPAYVPVLDERVSQDFYTGSPHVSVPGDNMWGFPMAASTVQLDNGKVLTYDDVTYGMNLLWQDLGHFAMTSWRGVQMQQNAPDAMVIQDLLWREKPDMLIEIGRNNGGGTLFLAEMMTGYNPAALVLSIDAHDVTVDWNPHGKISCPHCKSALDDPLLHSANVEMLTGFSTDAAILARVRAVAATKKKVFVLHDANHERGPVHNDLNLYDEFVSVGGYIIVQDTILDRTMKVPMALAGSRDFLQVKGANRYVVDKRYEYLLFSTNHNGFLRKVAA